MKYSAERRDSLLNSISSRAHSEIGLNADNVKYLTAIEHRYRKLDLEQTLELGKTSFSKAMNDIYSNSKKVAESLVSLEEGESRLDIDSMLDTPQRSLYSKTE